MSILIPFPFRWHDRRSYRAQRKKSGIKDELSYYQLIDELGLLSEEISSGEIDEASTPHVHRLQQIGRAKND